MVEQWDIFLVGMKVEHWGLSPVVKMVGGKGAYLVEWSVGGKVALLVEQMDVFAAVEWERKLVGVMAVTMVDDLAAWTAAWMALYLADSRVGG